MSTVENKIVIFPSAVTQLSTACTAVLALENAVNRLLFTENGAKKSETMAVSFKIFVTKDFTN